MGELWWANAFVGEAAGGNATGVVIGPAPDEAAVARDLRAPDTVFVDGDVLRFYSPYEGRMAFCGQALLAADAVLRARGQQGPRSFTTDAGPARTHATGGASWFSTPRERTFLVEVGPHGALVDSGRRRAFVRLGCAAEVDAVAVSPAEVLARCASLGISGLCWYAVEADVVRLRVLTVSLLGEEDAATGGAVLGLAALLPPGRYVVEQGSGHRLRRGRLLLDARAADVVAVGGVVSLVARGSLLPPSGEAGP